MTYERLLVRTIAEVMGADPAAVSTSRSFFEQGVDSMSGLRICRRLGDQLGFDVDLEWVFDHPTIDQLAEHLRGRAAEAGVTPATGCAPQAS